MELEYYTIQQASRRLNCFPDEVLHLVETGKLNASLLSRARRYMIVTPTADGVIGHAICWYRGLVSVHASWISSLIERQEIQVGAVLRLLDPTRTSGWVTEHGYKAESELSDVFSAWTPRSEDDFDFSRPLWARPYGVERKSLAYSMGEAIQQITQAFAQGKGVEIPEVETDAGSVPKKWVYSYAENGHFELEDIRVRSEALLEFESNSASRSVASVPEALITLQRGRVTDWHVVVERMIVQNPDASSRELLSLLRNDIESVDPEFDHSGVILEVGDDCLHVRIKGDEKRVSLKAFQNTVSKIKSDREKLT